MDELKLKMLLAQRTTVFDADQMQLANRIKSEHLFQSVTECVQYLTYIAKSISINPDDPKGLKTDNFRTNPILTINIVDEAICSIIREIYNMRDRWNPLELEICNSQISNLSSLVTFNNGFDHDCIRQSLQIVLYDLMTMSNPSVLNPDKFMKINKLSYDYYTLMLNMYNSIESKSEYTSKMVAFYKLKADICKKDI